MDPLSSESPGFSALSSYSGLRILPALRVIIPLATGIAAGCWVHIPFAISVVVVLVLGAASFATRRIALGDALLIAALFCAGLLSFDASLTPAEFRPVTASLTGLVVEPPVYQDDRVVFPVRMQTIAHDGDLIYKPGLVWVRLRNSRLKITSGVTVQLTGVLTSTPVARNPGEYDLRAYRRRNGYIGVFTASPTGAEIHTSTVIPPLHRLKNAILNAADRYGKEDAPLWKAVMLGARRDLDPRIVEDLRRTGLTHLLALSGLNVGFLAVIAMGAGTILRLPRVWRLWLALFAIIIFTLIVPARGSSLRAAVMLVALFGGVLLRRWSHPINSIAFAALAIISFRPGELLDSGFQLSFAAAAGIILFGPIAEPATHLAIGAIRGPARSAARYLLGGSLISLDATAFVLPLTSFHFATMASGAVLFNLVAIPLLSIMFAGMWLVCGLGIVSPSIAALAADGVRGVTAFWHWVVGIFAQVAPMVNWKFSPLAAALLLGLMVWLACGKNRLRFRLVASMLAIGLVVICDTLIPRTPCGQVWFLDVRHGDSAVWRFKDGSVAVIDGGPEPAAGNQSPLVTALRHFNIGRINLLVASHPEADHIGGLIAATEAFPISMAVTGPAIVHTETSQRLDSVLATRGVPWNRLNAGDQINGLPQRISLSVAGPPQDAAEWPTNDASLALRLTLEGGNGQALRLLTAGDVQLRGEMAMVARGDISTDLLKVSHHASPTSSSDAFLDAVHPSVAVVSRAGWTELGRYQSPEAVLQRLRARGIEIHETSEEGAIAFEPEFKDGCAEWRELDWRNPAFLHWLFGLT